MKPDNTINVSGLAALFDQPQAAAGVYFMLHSLQHRGPDAGGIAWCDQAQLKSRKGQGMLSEIFAQPVSQPGSSAIGQIQKSGGGKIPEGEIEPIMVRAHQGHFALVSEGRIENAQKLRDEMEEEGLVFQGTSDGELIAHLIQKNSGHLHEKITAAVQEITGSVNFLLLTKSTLYAWRSKDGIHPLWLAHLGEGGYALASEDCALHGLAVTEKEMVPPGTLIRLGKSPCPAAWTISSENAGLCGMEYVYYSRDDSSYPDGNVHQQRMAAGKKLARKETCQADMVIGVPDTAVSAAMGFAQALNLPYEIGLIKNRYIGSTFVRPSQQQRQQGMRVRLNAISAVCAGKRIFLVDDCLCKGATAKRLATLLKEAGAQEVHLRIASPKIHHTCPYGYGQYEPEQLAANIYSENEMAQRFGLDSVRFLDEEAFKSLLNENICMACMNGTGPLERE